MWPFIFLFPETSFIMCMCGKDQDAKNNYIKNNV